MKIHFTRHADEKFQVLAEHGWKIERNQVIAAVQTPDILDRHSRFPLLIVQAPLDENHVLRVVYREENGIALIITFYPGRKDQYAQF